MVPDDGLHAVARAEEHHLRGLQKTGCDINAGVDFKLHDFGYRGVSSVESAGIGGAAHLINFWGTDTMASLLTLKYYYGGNEAKVPLPTNPDIMLPVAGLSIPAAEHSTITSWGREGELKAFENMLDQYPEGLVAVVSDSYNVFEACSNLWGKELKEKIKNRKGTLVVRPDSGDPPVIVPQLLDLLGEAFKEDVTTTSTGHKLLPPYIRMIQGDGISVESLGDILNAMAEKGWAADNLAFGSGGACCRRLTATRRSALQVLRDHQVGRLVDAGLQGPDHRQGEAVEEGEADAGDGEGWQAHDGDGGQGLRREGRPRGGLQEWPHPHRPDLQRDPRPRADPGLPCVLRRRGAPAAWTRRQRAGGGRRGRDGAAVPACHVAFVCGAPCAGGRGAVTRRRTHVQRRPHTSNLARGWARGVVCARACLVLCREVARGGRQCRRGVGRGDGPSARRPGQEQSEHDMTSASSEREI